MQFRIGHRYLINFSVMRLSSPVEYTPALIDEGNLKEPISIPFFVYKRDRHISDDHSDTLLILNKLKAEGIYRPGLLFTGFEGFNLYKHGSYGKRSKTFAVTENALMKSATGKWRDRRYVNTPFLHMDTEGKNMPAIGIFDASKLIGGTEFDEASDKLPEYDKIAWWTDDGSSIDQAAVAVFFFKQYDSYDERQMKTKNEIATQG